MRRRKLQFVWHCHHDVLLEPLTQSITERRKYIKNTKPKNEVELRLKLFKPVKGKLPKEVIEAGKKFLYNNSTLWSIVSEVLNKNIDAINKLHKKECAKDCPWDGFSIFPETQQKLNLP